MSVGFVFEPKRTAVPLTRQTTSSHQDNNMLGRQETNLKPLADLENYVELGVEVRLETLPLQDGLKLVQKLERVLDGGNVFEALVDERLPLWVQKKGRGSSI